MNIFKKIEAKASLIVVTLAVAVTPFKAASQTGERYYSQDLINPGTLLSSASTGTTPFGSTNLVAANYPSAGKWLTLYAANSPNDPFATGVTFQFVTGVPYLGTNLTWTNGVSPWATNASQALTNNLIATFALLLDDKSISKDAQVNGILGTPSSSTSSGGVGLGPFPYSTNTTFTITNTVASVAGPSTYSVFVPGTNFLGNRHFSLVSLNYAGTNTPYLYIVSARAGYRY